MAVTPSTTAINRLGRMVSASVAPALTTDDLADALVMYAVVDGAGVIPGDTGWLETYDMAGAALECWQWKKAAAVANVNFNADGSQFSLSDISEHIEERIRYYSALRATGNLTVRSG